MEKELTITEAMVCSFCHSETDDIVLTFYNHGKTVEVELTREIALLVAKGLTYYVLELNK
jgi:hypothetical protein